MAGIIHTTVPTSITRRTLLTGSIGVFAGVTANRAAFARQQSGTPEDASVPEGGPQRIESLLRMVPGAAGEEAADFGVIFYYADVKRQLESIGVPAFEAGDEELPEGYVVATNVLAIAAQSYSYGLEPEFITTFGFSPLQAEETMTVGTPPNDLTIFRGGLPVDDLPAAWEASGFARESTDAGIDIWTAGKEGELDLTSNVSRYGLGGMNNVAIFGDTVVFTRFFAAIEAVVAQVTDPGESAADQVHMRELVATLEEDTVSAIGISGHFLNAESLVLPELFKEQLLDQFEAEIAEIGEFPEVASAIFAITGGALGVGFPGESGATPDASPVSEATESDGGVIQVRLKLDSEDDAVTAVAGVEERWNTWSSILTQEPFTDLMTLITAEPHPTDPTVAAIDFRGVRTNRIWADLVLQRDLLAFSWIGDAPPAEATPTAAG